MRKFIQSLILIALFTFGLKAAFADLLPIELYINSQDYGKPVFVNKNVLYVAVDDALSFIGIKVVRQGRVLCGVRSTYKGPACPESQSPALLYLDGKPIMQGILVHRDRPWISLPVLAKTLGYIYQYNSETGIADLISPSLNAMAALLPGQPPEVKIKSESKKKETKEKELLASQVEAPASDIYSTQNPNTYEIRTNFSVVNKSDHPVKGVTAKLLYLDGYGKPLETHSFNIGTMAAHATVKKEDYWINYTGVSNPNAKVELDWEGKSKE